MMGFSGVAIVYSLALKEWTSALGWAGLGLEKDAERVDETS